MALMTYRQYALHRKALGLSGTSHVAVGNAVKAGRIFINRNGLVDSEQADVDWAANTDYGKIHTEMQQTPIRQRAAKLGPITPTPRNVNVPAANTVPVEPPAASPFQQARTAKEITSAQLARLKLDRERGDVVDKATIMAACESVITVARTALLALPHRIKVQLPHIETTDIKTIDGLLRDAMAEMANGIMKVTAAK